MTFEFTPMTDEEIESNSLLEEGEYTFEVIKSTRMTSKKGNPMAEIILNIWDKEGRSKNVFDYLVFSNIPLNIKKVKHFCDSTGLEEEYKKGSIREDLRGLAGKVKIGIKDEQKKESGGFYPKKNIVINYEKIKLENNLIKNDISEIEKLLDDEIPF